MGIELNFGESKGKGVGSMSLGGKIFLTLFASVFIAAGVFATVMFIQTLDRRADQSGWDQVTCEILFSEVVIDPSSEDPYSPKVLYRYEVDGRMYPGKVAVEDGLESSDYRDAQAVVLDYPAGTTRTALVNPDNPADAVLRTKPIGGVLLLLLFPVFFCGGPLVLLYFVWRPGGRQEGRVKSISSKKTNKQLGPVGLTIIGLFIMAVAVGVGFPLAILPTVRTLDAAGWQKVEAQVKRSAVVRVDGDENDTYRVDILYLYDIDGQTYGSNNYSFLSMGSSSGSKGKREIVSQYPVGEKVEAYVDPNDPTRAVLIRGWRWWNLLGLIPLVFFGVGVLMCYAAVKKVWGGRDDPLAWHVSTRSLRNAKVHRGESGVHKMPAGSGPVTLRPTKSWLGKAAGLLLFTLIWNGIVSIFVYQVVDAFRDGSPDVCLTVFMIPFVIVGIVVFFAFLQSAMVIFAPVVEIGLDRRDIPLGGATRLTWNVAGRPGKLHGLTITLIGTESATYQRGTDTITDTHDFYTKHLYGEEHAEEQADPLLLPIDQDRGELTLQIPAETMHSFDGGSNKIIWKLKVRAWVPRWPDPKDEYELRILPMEVGG